MPYTYCHLLVDETAAWEAYHGDGTLADEAAELLDRLAVDGETQWGVIRARRPRMTSDMTLEGLREFLNLIRS